MRINKFLSMIFAMLFVLIAITPVSAQNRAWSGTAGQPEQFLIEVAKGNIPGHSVVHKFGKGNVGTAFTPITNSLVYMTPTAAVSLEIVSSVAGDALNGVGAHEYEVTGLNAAWEEITQTITAHATDGTIAVAVPLGMTRVYRWKVSSSGAYATSTVNSHTGTLTLRVAAAGATWSTIPILPRPNGQSQIACYTVPIGYRAFVYLQEMRVDSTKSADIAMFVRSEADDVTTPFSPIQLKVNFVGVSGTSTPDTNAPRDGFVAPADIMFMGKVASSTAEIVVDFEILLIKDGY